MATVKELLKAKQHASQFAYRLVAIMIARWLAVTVWRPVLSRKWMLMNTRDTAVLYVHNNPGVSLHLAVFSRRAFATVLRPSVCLSSPVTYVLWQNGAS